MVDKVEYECERVCNRFGHFIQARTYIPRDRMTG